MQAAEQALLRCVLPSCGMTGIDDTIVLSHKLTLCWLQS